jgi:hypothetical protein
MAGKEACLLTAENAGGVELMWFNKSVQCIVCAGGWNADLLICQSPLALSDLKTNACSSMAVRLWNRHFE